MTHLGLLRGNGKRFCHRFIPILMVLVSVAGWGAATWIVDSGATCIPFIGCFGGCKSGNGTYKTVQTAVNAANSGDTIKICDGTYSENVKVTTDNLKIISVHGAATVTIKKDSGHTITLDGVDRTTLEDLTIKKTGGNNKGAIYLKNWCDNTLIKNVILDSDDDGIYVKNNIGKLEVLDSNITGGDGGIRLKGKCDEANISNAIINSSSVGIRFGVTNNGVSIHNVEINSSGGKGIYFSGAGHGDINLTHLTIDADADGINFHDTPDNGIMVSHSTIHSETNRSIYFYKKISGDAHFDHLSLRSHGTGIHFNDVINDNIAIDNVEIHSTDGKGIYFKGNVWGDCTLSDLNITAKKRGIETKGGISIKPNITHSSITSTENDAVYISSNIWDDFTMQSSCAKTEISGSKYALKINRNGTKSTVKGNCFYAPAVNRLARAKEAGNPVSDNYWDGNSGDYTLNKISDTSTLSSCPLECGTTPPFVQPILDWRMDECSWSDDVADVGDSSDHNKTGTSKAGAQTESNATEGGVICRVGHFDGNTSYIERDDIDDTLKGTSSMSFWIKTTQTGDDTGWKAPGIAGIEQSGGGDDVFWGWIDGSGHIGISKGNDYSNSESATVINDDNWHHIVLTRDAPTGNVTIYIDGLLDKSGSSESGTVGTSFSSIGRIENTNSSKNPKYFSGDLDELKIYDRVLSDTDVQQIYNNEKDRKNWDGTKRSCTVCKQARPIADYRTDACSWDGSTGEVKDSSGNALDGTAQEATTEANTTAGGGMCRVGDFNNSSGDNQSVSVPDDDLLSPHAGASGQMTVMAWVKANAYPSSDQQGRVPIVAKGDDSNWEYALYLYEGHGVGFSVWQLDGNSYGEPADGDLSLHEWHHLAGVVDKSSGRVAVYMDGSLVDELTGSGSSGNGTSPLYLARRGSGNHYFDGEIDEVKIFDQALTQHQIQTIYDHERTQENYDGTVRHCQCGRTLHTVEFNAVSRAATPCNAAQDWDNNLTTQIDGSGFPLYILSRDATSGDPIEANLSSITLHGCNTGDYAQDILSHFPAQTQADGCAASTSDITVNHAIKCLQITIKGYDANATTDSDTNESNSTDDFAVRPDRFAITSPGSHRAGTQFVLTFDAYNHDGNGSTDYNESLNSSFKVEYNETQSQCTRGVLSLEDFNFSDGVKDLDTHYTEAGEINVSIQETNGSEFAQIDRDDTSDADRLIPSYHTTITFIPHHFDLNATMDNFDHSSFTYLSEDLTMSAAIDVVIKAENEQNNTTQNFNPQCYGHDVNVTIAHSQVARDNVSRMLSYYTDANGSNHPHASIGKNAPWTIAYPQANFSAANSRVSNNGETKLTLHFNFDRAVNKPVNPFDLNLSSITVAQGATSSTDHEATEGNATFYYGKLYIQDIVTSKSSVTHTAFVEFYDDNLTDYAFIGYRKLRTLGWYGFADRHDTDHGAVIESNVTDGKRLDSPPDDTVTLNPAANFVGNFTISNTAVKTRIVHVAIPTWLWYDPYSGNPYDYTPSSSCKAHPCFAYRFLTDPESTGRVQSGQASGSDFTVKEGNVTYRGIKLFR